MCFQLHSDFLLRCNCSVLLFEVEQNLNGSSLTLGVRKSASLPCHACSSLSFTSQKLTVQFTFATHSSTPSVPPNVDRTSVIPANVKGPRLVLQPIRTASKLDEQSKSGYVEGKSTPLRGASGLCTDFLEPSMEKHTKLHRSSARSQ